MGRFDHLNEIQRLDPERDHQRIMHLSFGYEFPWDWVRALEIALYRTYCVPSISGVLDRSGEFYRDTQRRYDDTAILIAEMCEWGYEGGRGKAALDRINWAHSRGGLKLRGRFVRFLPPRREPHFFTDDRNRTHPRGYEIRKLGPPRLVAGEERTKAPR